MTDQYSSTKWYLNWRSYVAIVCLLFPVPIIGLILMWFIAPWNIKAKRIIAFIYIGLPIILALTVFFYLQSTAISRNGVVDQAIDARRKSDVGNIVTSARSYCAQMGTCATNPIELTAKTFPSYINYMPSDPKTTNNYPYRLTEDGKNCEVEATLSTGEQYILKCFE